MAKITQLTELEKTKQHELEKSQFIAGLNKDVEEAALRMRKSNKEFFEKFEAMNPTLVKRK